MNGPLPLLNFFFFFFTSITEKNPNFILTTLIKCLSHHFLYFSQWWHLLNHLQASGWLLLRLWGGSLPKFQGSLGPKSFSRAPEIDETGRGKKTWRAWEGDGVLRACFFFFARCAASVTTKDAVAVASPVVTITSPSASISCYMYKEKKPAGE